MNKRGNTSYRNSSGVDDYSVRKISLYCPFDLMTERRLERGRCDYDFLTEKLSHFLSEETNEIYEYYREFII